MKCVESVCSFGTCVGECEPGAQKCFENDLGVCSQTGTWEVEPCHNSACVAGACLGRCVPGSVGCDNNAASTCDDVGEWQGVPCPSEEPRCNAGICASCGAIGGADMVPIPLPGADGYCIDATEVTRSEYETWLVTNPSTAGQETTCASNGDYVPSCEWPPGSKANHPVVCVDWCDAYAYCKGVGKRLCGAVGGGTASYPADFSVAQWLIACSVAGSYAYGASYEAQTCNGADLGLGGTVQVGSLPTCRSYAGAYDLSGNVWEWTDVCAAGECRVWGGAYDSYMQSLRCDSTLVFARQTKSTVVGFRCCSVP